MLFLSVSAGYKVFLTVLNQQAVRYWLPDELWQETADDEDDDAANEHGNGLLRATLPLLEDDAPDVGEHDVEGHEDAEGQRGQRSTAGEEALAQGQSEELRVPKGTGQQAEHEVVGPDAAFLVVAPGAVNLVLIEAIEHIGDESAEGDEQRGGERAEHRVGQFAEVNVLAKLQAHVEAAAHKACQQGNGQSLGEVEVLHRRLLLLL